MKNIFLCKLKDVADWASKHSMWPLAFGTSCCAIEMMHAAVSRTDLDMYGCLFRASPKQADLMIVAGTITVKMVDVVKTLYDQMLEPKYVIAMGSCAATGGIYENSQSVVKGVDKIIPVDVVVNGCPPLPEDLVKGILQLMERKK